MPSSRIRHTILVNKWDNTLRYYVTGQPMRTFHVATGLYRCTPEGRFRIIQKSFISRSGRGQFGTRWLGLNTMGKRGWYRIGIHGTNQPQTIGKHASKACVRMRNRDINWLYDRVPYNTTVRIVDVPVAKPKPKMPAPLLTWLRKISKRHVKDNQLRQISLFNVQPTDNKLLSGSAFHAKVNANMPAFLQQLQQSPGGNHEVLYR
ncbi:MAG TPA: L,D-transpeptidase [Abditibacteriaceae bacterium]